MVGPWIHALFGRRKRLSDIEYLSIKEFDSKLVTNTGQQADGGTGNAATLTASSGKDLYLAKAQATVRTDTATTIILAEITLVVNGVIKDRWEYSNTTSTTSGQTSQPHDFAVQGVKVAATQTIILDVVASNVDFDITGTLVGFEETTGESPAV